MSILVSLLTPFSLKQPLVAQTSSTASNETVELRRVRPVDRITSFINDRLTVVRSGNRHPLARPEYDAGIASPDIRMERMMLALQPDAAQQKALEALLAAQQDSQSPQFHQWLSPESFGRLFGVSESDLNEVVGWLRRRGFEVEPIPSGRRVILFSGTVEQVESAFHTAVHVYNVNGKIHYANATDPEIPQAMGAVVAGVVSLHDFHAKPLHRAARAEPAVFPGRPGPAVSPAYTSGGTHYLAPADFATIYDLASLYAASIDGTGQSIAIAGRSNFSLSDVQTFRSQFGLPANDPKIIINGTDPGTASGGDQTEAELDVEWAGAVARNAAIQYVASASTRTSDGVALSVQYIVNHNLAPVLSLSFGECEAALGTAGNQFWNALWQQAAAQGMSVFVASGDSGAAGCDSSSSNAATGGNAVNGLCSSLNSTCVGGTEFNDTSNPALYWSASMNPNTDGSALSYIPEASWNESGTVTGGSQLWASGGGASAVYAKPSWQAGTGVPSDGRRDVPDVALSAAEHDAYLIRMNGQNWVVGGTSAAAPSFAGLMALAVQRAGARQGNANPRLYALAAAQSNGGAAVFHDIMVGNNSVPGLAGHNAGVGYDLVTGLGSVDASLLVNHWSGNPAPAPSATPTPTPAPTPTPTPTPARTPTFQLSVIPASVSLTQGASKAATVTVAVSGGFNSAIALSTSALLSGLTGSFSPANLAAPGSGSSAMTVNAGAHTITGAYTLAVTARGGGIAQTITLPVVVSPSCTYTISPTRATPGCGRWELCGHGDGRRRLFMDRPEQCQLDHRHQHHLGRRQRDGELLRGGQQCHGSPNGHIDHRRAYAYGDAGGRCVLTQPGFGELPRLHWDRCGSGLNCRGEQFLDGG